MVLEWTLGRKRLAYSMIDLSLCCMRQSTSQGNMGDSEPPDILCESCACIIHTNLQSCMSIFSETLYMYNTQSVAMETNYYIVTCILVHALLNVILYFTGGKTSNKNLKFEFNMLQIMHSI